MRTNLHASTKRCSIKPAYASEPFLLIERDALKAITLPPWTRGCSVNVTCGGGSAGLTLPSQRVPAAIDEPVGGTTTDAEARAAIAQILDALRNEGLLAS